MASSRTLCTRKKLNYAEKNTYKLEQQDSGAVADDSDLEEGQLRDSSPFQVEALGDKFAEDIAPSDFTFTEAKFPHNQFDDDNGNETNLDYVDDLGSDAQADIRRVVSREESDGDIASDEVWSRQ